MHNRSETSGLSWRESVGGGVARACLWLALCLLFAQRWFARRFRVRHFLRRVRRKLGLLRPVDTTTAPGFWDRWAASSKPVFLHNPELHWLDRLDNSRRLETLGPVDTAGVWVPCFDNGNVSFAQEQANDRFVHAGILLQSRENVSLRSLWHAFAAPTNELWLREPNQWVRLDLNVFLAVRLAVAFAKCLFLGTGAWFGLNSPRLRRTLLSDASRAMNRVLMPELVFPDAEASVQFHGVDDPARRLSGNSPRIVHLASSLYPGGAERQLFNLASAQHARGLDVAVLTCHPLEGDNGHYRPLFEKVGLRVRQARSTWDERARLEGLPWHQLRGLPPHLWEQIHHIAVELEQRRPAILHCWLDDPNVLGALAGLLVGVPRILLSLRATSPETLPRLNFPYLQSLYRLVTQSPRVHLIANSRAGAASYAEWIGLPAERIQVIHNGLAEFEKPSYPSRAAARQALDLPQDAPVVCGLFRLADEKQPELFLEVVRRVRDQVPGLKVLQAGAGDLAAKTEAMVEHLDLGDCVRLLGRRNDVPNILLTADVCLLTSNVEGCPNVSLEAQHLGVPMVATAAGGTPDTIDHGRTGFVAGVTDAGALAGYVTRLLTDGELRQRMSQAGPEFIAARFGQERMVVETLELYRSILKVDLVARAA